MAKDLVHGAYEAIYDGTRTSSGAALTNAQCAALWAELDHLRKVEELAERLVNEPLIKTLQRLLDRVHGTSKP